VGVVTSGTRQRPPRSANVEPSSTPPWRVLETPLPDDPARATTTAQVRTPSPATLKVAAGVIAAVTCVGLAVAVALSGGGADVRVEGGSSFGVADPSGDPVPSGATAADALIVEIVGAVQAPGVYRLAPGSRVADLVERAGGYGPRVDTARAEQELNLAAPVKDGEHIRVPSRDDASEAPAAAGPAGSAGTGALVDINSATQAQLEELPGIGPATAQKIIAAREEAPFGAVEELRSRGVLGEKTFEKLRPLVTAG
jgi:competence protein ComEA